MRLINSKTLQVEEFADNARPKYAILSHTWGTQEVSLHQLQRNDGTINSKAGFSKIKRTCSIALERGLQYAWVDTCCIDKSSSAELSESINSMFRWYEEAEVCFSYLADVTPTTPGSDGSFEASRWFTRGWTLQELLAPSDLEFFASDWTPIGNRNDLTKQISSITGINELFLANPNHLSCRDLMFKASIAERMSWASKRTTTREEDIAYSLLGIFGVNMPLLYGESTRAFLRLQQEILTTSFDPTILAWTLRGDESEPVTIDEPGTASILALQIRSTDRIGHGRPDPLPVSPWYAADLRPPNTKSIGALAPSPACFAGSGDVISCGTALDWTITSQGLEVTLPVSEDKSPFAVLLCQLRHNPRALLAVPLQHHERNVYSRSHFPFYTVTHDRWYQWEKRRFLLRTGLQSDLSAAEKPLCRLWVRKVPGSMRLLDAFSADGWVPAKGPIDVHFTSESDLRRNFEMAALLLESKTTGQTFAVIIRVFKAPGSHGNFWGQWKGFGGIDCRFVESTTREELHSMVKSYRQYDSLKNHLTKDDRVVYVGVRQKHTPDFAMVEITIQESPGLMKRLSLAVDYRSKSILNTAEYFRLRSALSLAHTTAGLCILMLVLSWLGTPVGSVLARWNCSGSISSNSDQLLRWLRAASLAEAQVVAWFLWRNNVFRYLPLLSLIAPRRSAFLRRNRWTLAYICGTLFSLIIPYENAQIPLFWCQLYGSLGFVGNKERRFGIPLFTSVDLAVLYILPSSFFNSIMQQLDLPCKALKNEITS